MEPKPTGSTPGQTERRKAMYENLIKRLRWKNENDKQIFEAETVELAAEAILLATEAIKKLQAELERMEKERDSAVKDIPHTCEMCKFRYLPIKYADTLKPNPCLACRIKTNSNWQWRGLTARDTAPEVTRAEREK